MTCFEVSVNGSTVCRAGISDNRETVMTALVCATTGQTNAGDVPQHRFTLDVDGADDELQMTWLQNFDRIRLGDTITVRLLECPDADPPRTQMDTKTLRMRREEAEYAEDLRCSFCGLPQDEQRKLVAGRSVFVSTTASTFARRCSGNDGDGRYETRSHSAPSASFAVKRRDGVRPFTTSHAAASARW